MNYAFLKFILWVLLGLPIFIATVMLFVRVVKEVKRAEKANQIDE